LHEIQKWSISNQEDDEDEEIIHKMGSSITTSFDFNADFDELCCVNESGVVSFVRMAKLGGGGGVTANAAISSSMQFFSKREKKRIKRIHINEYNNLS